jgi:NADPH2:quinone reductase
VISVVFADVMWLDTAVRGGHGGSAFPIQPPYRPGIGVAGIVETLGDGVPDSWARRRVIARSPEHGGYAETAIVPATSLIPVPDEVDLRDAAALLHDGTTAVTLLDIAKISSGDRVLITAAAGGLGILLLKLARTAGAQVVAAARGTRKLERLQALGADLIVDYSRSDWLDQVRGAMKGVDVVLDGAGGSYGRAALDLIVPGGRFSAHGTPSGTFATVDKQEALARRITATGIQDVQLTSDQFYRNAKRVLNQAASGLLKPLVGQTFPLEHADQAHVAIENRSAIGKTLLVP